MQTARAFARAATRLARVTGISAICIVAMFGGASFARAAPAKVMDLTIYHIEMRRSLRVIWLCEELGIPYKLVFKQGDIMGSLQLIREVNPLMPVAPTIRFNDQTVMESGAILELLLAHYGKGRLVPQVDSPDFAYYLEFLHFAEGTAMARLTVAMTRAIDAKQPVGTEMPQEFGVGPRQVLAFMEDHLAKHPYFGGQEFTAADIMMHFVTRTSGLIAGVDADSYPHVAAWRKKVQERAAFKRALDASLPGGHDADGNGYGLPIPFSNPPAVYKRPE